MTLRFSPPAAVTDIAARLEQAGFETWCVGGAVRDALLGHEHLDWDLATAATPEDVQRIFRRTIPIGIAFGTLGVIGRDGKMYEVTTFRHDVETDGRHARVRFGASLDEDLARRDFTINAMAYSPMSHRFHDPFGGRQDLALRLVRTVGDADARMGEDRLRALRAIRFSARFGFAIAPDTWSAMERSAPHLTRLSAERVKQELEKTMEQVARPSAALRLWQRSGALAALVPALSSISERTLATLDQLALPQSPGHSRRRVLRLAALFLDVDPVGVGTPLRELRFSNADAAWIVGVLERVRDARSEVERAVLGGEAPSSAVARRWAAAIGRTHVAYVFRVYAAMWSATRAQGGDAPTQERVQRWYRAVLRAAFNDPVELADLAVDGGDLVAAGIPPGPRLGKILDALLAGVIEDPRRNTPDALVARARELYGGMR